MIHSCFQVRGLHPLLIVVETLWCHISVDSDTPSLTHVLPCILFPRVQARSSLAPLSLDSSRVPLCEQAHTFPSLTSHPSLHKPKTSLMQNFQSVLLSNAHLLHNLLDPDAPRIRNQAYKSLADVLDLVVRVQEADVPLHDRLRLCLERWFVGLRSRL
jgi:hypothetical protein